MSAATYLYCVVSAAQRLSTAGVPPGIPSASPPEILGVDKEVSIVAASVPLDVYGPGKLDAALRNIDWVGDVALAHERVVEHFAAMKGVTVVPMKLFTMFSTPARAVADITTRLGSIRTAVKQIAGAEEWGIRVMRAPGADAAAPASTPTSGAAFLAAKKQKRDSVREARAAAAEAALAAYAELSRFAKDARRREDPPPVGTTPPLLDAAFLVVTSKREQFTAAARSQADACARAGAQLTLSGPWPAYSFIQGDGGR